MGFLASAELERAATILAGTLSEKQRQSALDGLARVASSDAARLLIDLYHLTPWGPHRRAIVRTLGRFADSRTIEFLYRIAVSDSDLTQAREAVLALGCVPAPQAQEAVFALAQQPSFLFQREAVHSLRNAPQLPVVIELQNLFLDLKQRGVRDDRADRIFDAALLVLASHSVGFIESDLIGLLRESAAQNGDPDLLSACLLAAGALGGANVREAVSALEVDETEVVSSLKSTVLKLIDSAPHPSIESVISDLSLAIAKVSTNNGSPAGVSFHLARLTRFSDEELQLAESVLAGEISIVCHLWVKVFRIGSLAASDVLFLVQEVLLAGDAYQISFTAKAVRKQCLNGQLGDLSWRGFLGSLGLEETAALSLHFPDETITEVLCSSLKQREQVSGGGLPPRFKDERSWVASLIRRCNGLVAQAQMTVDESVAWRCLDVFERMALDTSRPVVARGRAIRAIGQIGFVGRAGEARHARTVELLGTLLRQSGPRAPLMPSIIHALGHLSSEPALASYIQVLQSQIDSKAQVQTVELLLVTLILFPRALLAGVRLSVHEQLLADEGIARLCLRLLGLGVIIESSSVGAQRRLVTEALISRDFSDLILGLDASHVLTDPGDWALVQNLAVSDHEAIRSLALERICRSRISRVQNHLVSLLSPATTCGAELLLHCFDLFEVDEQDPPFGFAEFLVEVCKFSPPALGNQSEKHYGPFQRADVRIEGVSLAEQILALRGAPVGLLQSVSLSAQRIAVGSVDGHALTDIGRIESCLRLDLPLFDSYSETLKSVLRNAELPFSHPEIFDDGVDKSTAIIEFVKSIDLLLQERIGEPLFLGSRAEVLARLQSRVARLGLQDIGSDNARLLRHLCIDHVFTPELFPSIKLGKLVHAILAGKFVSEQVRILDGIKGWAVFLLLFARSFKV
jgi:hypothetical protein